MESFDSDEIIDSFTYPENYNQIGGQGNDIPNGGFPPIVICKTNTIINNDTEEKTQREYTTHKTSVSIKDILEQRRNKIPIKST